MQKLIISSDEYFALPHASNSGIKEAYELFIAGKDKPDYTNALRFGSAFDALTTDITELDQTGVDMQTVLKMKEALHNNSIYNTLFKNAETQNVYTDEDFHFEHDGMRLSIPAKCKFDLFNTTLNFGGDLKTTAATSQEQFEAAAKHFQYHRQAAWYMDITNTDRFPIIAVSKKNFKTFIISIKRNDPQYMEGKRLYQLYAMAWWKLFGN